MQLNHIDTELRRIRRNLAVELAAGTASMAAVLTNPHAVLFGLLAAAAGAAGKTSRDYLDKVRGHQAYFLWRASRRR